MRIRFSGIVELGDECRCSDDVDNGAVRIGGVDVVQAICDRLSEGQRVTVAVADERFDGDLAVCTGWGYSEWTPMEGDELRVGPHNIVETLSRLDGQHVNMFVGDEPGNVLDPDDWELVEAGEGA